MIEWAPGSQLDRRSPCCIACSHIYFASRGLFSTRVSVCKWDSLRFLAILADTLQLVLIISDGRVLGEWDAVGRKVREAVEKKMLPVLILLDPVGPSGQPGAGHSILEVKRVVFGEKGGGPKMLSMLDDYPLPFYLLCRHLPSLPNTLADALTQWFQLCNTE